MKRILITALTFFVVAGIMSVTSAFASQPVKVQLRKAEIKSCMDSVLKSRNGKFSLKVKKKGPVSFTLISSDDIRNNKKLADWYERNYKKKGIHYKHKGNTVYVIVSAGEKPTGGYKVGINSVKLAGKHVAHVSAFVAGPSPDMIVTQAVTYPHVLIRLDNRRIKKVKGTITDVKVDTEKKPIPYDVLTLEEIREDKVIYDWYQSIYKTKGIFHSKSGGNLYIAVNAGEKRTGGYSVKIDEVVLINSSRIFVTAHVNSPAPGSIVTTALTYPSVLIRVKAEGIINVNGEIKDDGAEKTFGDVVREYTAKDVLSMELRDLQGSKIRDFEVEERARILSELNKAIIDDSPYIQMIAGNSLHMTMVDGTTINLWSYGSETNYIAVVKSGENYNSYHLIGPEIARILFQKK